MAGTERGHDEGPSMAVMVPGDCEPPQRKAVLPQAEFVTVPPPPPETPPQEIPATEEAPTAEADPPAPPESVPEPAPDDPLRALKAMTENERLAIFS